MLALPKGRVVFEKQTCRVQEVLDVRGSVKIERDAEGRGYPVATTLRYLHGRKPVKSMCYPPQEESEGGRRAQRQSAAGLRDFFEEEQKGAFDWARFIPGSSAERAISNFEVVSSAGPDSKLHAVHKLGTRWEG